MLLKITFKPQYLLFIIILIAAVLRFYALGASPPSLTWDEAAWGYNSYALGIDGRDEFGRFLPYDYIESYGDFKPPVYAYLGIIPVKLFGLNEFSTRLPSALFGTLTVILTYYLVKRIFYNCEHNEQYALLGSFFLAVSPWHINLSRAAFEANVATFFIVAGVLAFLISVQTNKLFILISALCFAVTVNIFNTPRVVSPLIVLLLVAAFWKKLFTFKKEVIIAFFLGLLVVLPNVNFFLSQEASLRFKEVNIFSDLDIIKNINKQTQNDGNTLFTKIIHNRRLVFGVEYLKHYLDHFNPRFLFINGDKNPRFSTQDVGQMYVVDSLFLILGLGFLIKKKEGLWWIIPSWLLLGIIPAAAARETPHALRIESSLPMFQVLAAYGAINSILWIKRAVSLVAFRAAFTGVTILLVIDFFVYIHGYYTYYSYQYATEWQYGYKEAVLFASSRLDSYDKIYVTTKLGRPYIYFLLYTQENPNYFRSTLKVKRDNFGFVTVEGYSKYRFKDNLSNLNIPGEKVLYVNVPKDVPQNAKKLKDFNIKNGEVALTAYEL